jgi:tRNA dimethylallyltransferase
LRPPLVLVLTGATGCGKTDLTRNLFTGSAALGKAEIICADSVQVYKGMDLGAAKPSPDLRLQLPHYIIDILNPDEPFSAGGFVSRASSACLRAAEAGALPVVCGGSLFYLSAFINGMPKTPLSDAEIRNRLKKEFNEKGSAALMEELKKIDPVSAGRIHINDSYRLLRALEVFRQSGKPLSAFNRFGFSDCKEKPFRFVIASVTRNRDELYRRIEKRVFQMMKEGLAREVEGLYKKGYTPGNSALRAIGYKEFFYTDEDGAFRLAAERGEAGEEEIAAEIAKNTRHYAKRQLSWIKSLNDVTYIPLDEDDSSFIRAKETLQNILKEAL